MKDSEIRRDAVFSLAVIDRMEAAIRDGLPSAERDAKEFIRNSLDYPNGTMFALCGLKSMLVWMQQDTEPETQADLPAGDFWQQINASMSDETRDAFEAFRERLYLDADRLRDLAKVVACNNADLPIAEAADDLVKLICSIPSMRPTQ